MTHIACNEDIFSSVSGEGKAQVLGNTLLFLYNYFKGEILTQLMPIKVVNQFPSDNLLM